MGDIKINDLNLLKHCYREIIGEEFPHDGNKFPADKYACLGEYHEDKEPFWVVIFHSFIKNHDCMLELFINKRGMFSRSAFKRMADVVFNYVFCQAKLNRCSVQVRKSNKPSMRLARAWGFEFEGIKTNGYEPPRMEDMYLFGLLKSNCKWI
jgi:RimJ/RimL family protein N-acetyltransferase